MCGTLFLCATPIGNLGDITFRVKELLETVDLIAAEDTRHTLKLLNKFEIKTPMTSYHEYNKTDKGLILLHKLKEGLNIALVSDAGMPGISDPGADMVRLCHEAGVPITVLPGACASVTALVLSGMDTRRFVFEGFLPSDKKEHKKVLELLEREHRTMVFYEAPHRLVRMLEELILVFGEERKCACVREITKKYEECLLNTLKGQIAHFKENPPKGEFVIVVEGLSLKQQREEEKEEFENISIREHMDKYINKGMPEKEAMKQVAKDRGVPKRDIYSYLHIENQEKN